MTLNILVVDDNREMALMMQMFLQKKGYAVAVAGNVSDALSILKNQSIDIVISDVVLQDISGLSILKTIKSRGSFIPVVMMSAYVNREIAVECLSLGAYDFLFKPFRLSVLEDILKEVAERRERWIKGGII